MLCKKSLSNFQIKFSDETSYVWFLYTTVELYNEHCILSVLLTLISGSIGVIPKRQNKVLRNMITKLTEQHKIILHKINKN